MAKLTKKLKKRLRKIIGIKAKKIAAKQMKTGPQMDSAIGIPPVIFRFEGESVLTGITRPQRDFRLQKAVFEATLNEIALAAGITIVVDSIVAGMYNCLSANAAMPLQSFRYDAIGNRINAPKIDKGTDMLAQFRLVGGPMPADGQAVVTGAFWGEGYGD